MKVAKTFARGVAWILLMTAISSIAGYFSKIFLAKALIPSDLGIYSLLFVVLVFSATFFSLGIPTSINFYISRYAAENKEISNLFATGVLFQLFFTSIAASILILFPGPLAEYVFHDKRAVDFLRLFSIILIILGIRQLLKQVYFSQQKPKYTALSESAYSTLLLITSILAWRLGWPLKDVLVFVLVLPIFASFIIDVGLILKLKIGFGKFQKNIIKKFFSYSFKTYIGDVSWFLLLWTDTLCIAIFLGPLYVGNYVLAVSIVSVSLFFFKAFGFIFLPTISSLSTKKDEMVGIVISKSLQYAFFVAFPIAISLSVLSGPIIGLFFPKYHLAKGALQVLVFGYFFATLTILLGMSFAGLNRPEITAKWYSIAVVVDLALNIALIPLFGLIGAAFATTATFFLLIIILGFKLNKTVKVSVQRKKIASSLISALIMGAGVGLVRNVGSIYTLAGVILMGVIIYVLLMTLLKGIDKEDLVLLKTAK